ncbi:Testicular acid phosphatase [Clonorchis sinensis]|uniref:Testicular acid phosphatase n=1 Tax=Clonorchis sinensis TaxID=79923 RepID=A0A419PGX0_CLOSI|nr:Testicular acid phosphatase [Clonorchis sinensis]
MLRSDRRVTWEFGCLAFYFLVHNPPVKSLPAKQLHKSDAHSSNDALPHGLKLQNLHILFRHGDRTALEPMLKDAKSFEETWPLGRGQLTEEGVLQEFKLGVWLRQEYNGFIHKKYNASNFYLRSTDYDRTLMSAQAVAAGLYHDVTSPLKTYGIAWMPIPVHAVRRDRETLLSLSFCHQLELLRQKEMTSKKADEYAESHKALFDLINEHSVTEKIDRFNIWKLSDLFVCMRAHKMTLPSWCTEEIFQEIEEVAKFFWLLQSNSSEELLRLEIGVFLNTFVEHLRSITTCNKPIIINGRQLGLKHTVAYSAHDTHVSYLIGAFGAQTKGKIPYSSAIILELLGPDIPSSPEHYRLRLRFKQGYPDETGEYVSIKPCAGQRAADGCPLDLVLKYLQPYLLDADTYSEVCSGQPHTAYSNMISGRNVTSYKSGTFCLIILCSSLVSTKDIGKSCPDNNLPPGMTLQNLHLVFRHGDRTALEHLLNDSARFEEIWPIGRGQLTDKGVLQSFKLGMWLRQQYDCYLKPQYNASDFYIRSTDYDRTLMSAQAVAAGLYPQKSSPLEPYGIQWKPVPVHTIPRDRETLLSVSKCNHLETLRHNAMTSETAISFLASHRSLFHVINANRIKVKIDQFNIWKLHDMFICMRAHNIPLPSWCTEEIFQELDEVGKYLWLLISNSTNELIKIEIGVFLKAFVEHLGTIVGGDGSIKLKNGRILQPKHIMSYSAHDTHVGYILGAMGVLKLEKVPYAGAVILELIGPDPPSSLENYRLRLRYKQGYSDEIGEYRTLPSCPGQKELEGCPLDLVLQQLEPFLLDAEEYSKLCSELSHNVRASNNDLQEVRPNWPLVCFACMFFLCLN